MKPFGNIAAFLLLATVSCTKPVLTDRAHSTLPITLSASARATRNILQGTGLPSSYTIYASAFFTNATGSQDSGNYFVARPFRQGSGPWVSDPVSYWPMGGELDFLFVACEDAAIDIGRSAVWGERNCTEGVEVTLNDGECADSEILFGAACGRTFGNGSVTVQLKHAQSWLEFVLTALEGPVRIDGIIIEDIYSGGTLRVQNYINLDAGWSFRGHHRVDSVVPGSEGLILPAGDTVRCSVLVPEQESCDITVNYSIKADTSNDWSATRDLTSRFEALPGTWFCGEKNIFRINFSFPSLTMESEVSGWLDGDDYSEIL